jgi:MYXO-CTERM domain-containing protein
MWTRKLGIVLLASTFAGVLTLPASAQNAGDNRSGVETRSGDEGFDLGWLGLAGLIGLIGLRRRDDAPRTVHTANR